MVEIFSRIDPRSNMLGFMVFVFVLIFLGGATAFIFSGGGNESRGRRIDPPSDNVSKKFQSISPNTLVYGSWSGNESVITAYDLSIGKEFVLARLPSNIKHVNVLSSTELIYISDTDDRDYGSELVLYNLLTQSTTLLVAADEEFGIDDYRVSKSGELIVLWEVSPDPDSGLLLGGRSRVIVINRSNTNFKETLYDEVANPGNPVHYPLAITNSGDVITDKFLPNDGVGWAYGVGRATIGTNFRNEYSSMTNGTFSSQPQLTNDQNRMIFIGYNGSKGNGSETIDGGPRRAHANPNTIELLEIESGNRTRLSGLSDNNFYQIVDHDILNNIIIFEVLSKNTQEDGVYEYDLLTNSVVKIDNQNIGKNRVFSMMSSGVYLTISDEDSDSLYGNLGRYARLVNSMSILDTNRRIVTPIRPTQSFIQLIDIKSGNYFNSDNLTVLISSEDDENVLNTQLQLQLKTIVFKPELAPKRKEQQSDPLPIDGSRFTCVALRAYLCSQLLGIPPEATWFTNCFGEVGARASEANCLDSPLFLYGDRGISVKIYVGTPIYNTNVSYNPIEGFSAVLNGDGTFTVNEGVFPSLSFDYDSGIKIVAPEYGRLVLRSDLENEISDYANSLGLNINEKRDVLNYVKANLAAPYIMISHFNQDTSKKILPLYFDPQPDNYYNIVFYFKEFEEKPDIALKSPRFGQIKNREGFTAVEVSYIKE